MVAIASVVISSVVVVAVVVVASVGVQVVPNYLTVKISYPKHP